MINNIPEPIRKSLGGFKDKIVSLFKTNTPKQTAYGRGKRLSKRKAQNKIINIRNPFILKNKKKIKIEQLEILGHFMKQKKKKINK